MTPRFTINGNYVYPWGGSRPTCWISADYWYNHRPNSTTVGSSLRVSLSSRLTKVLFPRGSLLRLSAVPGHSTI